ncbi:MAG: ParA family protein [Clostridiales bacterium]|nr:ParA family protein [Clostridiales bacterium]
MSHIITVTNQKGGVGKTTTCCSLVNGLHLCGYKVLGVDLDPQGNLGFCLGVDIESGLTIYDILKGSAPTREAIQSTGCGDVLPSNILLSSAELEFNRSGREFILRSALEPVRGDYDFIVIDTPPALSLLTVNAYVTSDSLIIPMVPEVLSLLGISQLKDTIEVVRKFYNPNLRIFGVLLTKYNKHLNLVKEVEEIASAIAAQLETSILNVKIRNNVAVAEAPAHGQSIISYAPKSNAASDYAALVQEICAGI